ncbi:hypothetical protein [Anaeromyxobacter terrae]|uniref:hypothetical protein n=1 Tax=Anaeromyxobacter terrae TaxID=2925406 RepID=UPI001F5967F8|nr:hypothetical protein [Anaeromyxobacter sp. SG22]
METLRLDSLKRVTELPSFRSLERLRSAVVVGLSVRDLTSVSEAPSLAELIFIGRRGLSPDVALPFVRHPSLRKATFSLGDERKDRRVREMLALPPVFEA